MKPIAPSEVPESVVKALYDEYADEDCGEGGESNAQFMLSQIGLRDICAAVLTAYEKHKAAERERRRMIRSPEER